MNDGLGKKAEKKIKEWLNLPEDGYSFDRIPDQLSGYYGSSNICDFTCYKYPFMYYIESKATYSDRFDFSMLSDIQRNGLSAKDKIFGVYGIVIVLFAEHQRAFIFSASDIQRCLSENITKSVNIKKIEKWPIRYAEIETIKSRKELLDYSGNLEDYVKLLESED